MRPVPFYRQAADEHLMRAECWCRASTVGVPRDEVRACLTRPCDRPKCREIDRKERAA